MKRQGEFDSDNHFFKKTRIDEPSDSIKKLIEIAFSYRSKLHHINSSGFYLSQSWWRMANDFILHFCDGIGKIPSAIKNEVLNTFEKRREKGVEFDLCCWEFCCLVFFECGIVSREQIDDLCYIVYKSNEYSEDLVLTLADAFYQAPLESYQKHCPQSLPSPGDLLIFIRAYGEHNAHEVSHTAICTDNKGGYIELMSDCVSCDNLKDFYELEAELLAEHIEVDIYDAIFVYYVPFDEIQQNIKNFLHLHQNLLKLKKTGIKDESEVLAALNGTKYDQLARDCLIEKQQSANNTDFIEVFLESVGIKQP